jgi:uncharacterized protein YhbP (UPF0306 family)
MPLPPALHAPLRAHSTLTLAYTDRGEPHACALRYAVAPRPGDPVLYFLSAAHTRHGRALSQSPPPRIAFTAQADHQDLATLTGLQGTGVCALLTGDERAAALAAYGDALAPLLTSAAARDALRTTEVWALSVSWLRLVDNGRGFGHREEWTRPA